MTESAEVGYWQAVVDDQRVANERLHETIAEVRAEVARLRAVLALGAKFVHKADRHLTIPVVIDEPGVIVEEVINPLLEKDTQEALREFTEAMNAYLLGKQK